MFVMTMPRTFKIADSADCRINKQPARITWRDANTLVIEPDDARVILGENRENDPLTFFCGDASYIADDTVDADEAFAAGFIISRHKP